MCGLLLLLLVAACTAQGGEEEATDFDDWFAKENNETRMAEQVKEEKVEWVRDGVWEAMVTTAWQDYITRLNREKALYGLTLEPLELGLVTEKDELRLERSVLGYQVELTMKNLSLHGLSSLSLSSLSLSRHPNLTSILGEGILDAPNLLLTGVYSIQATSWLLPDLSSEGEQQFSINITRARIRSDLKVELVAGCKGEVEEVEVEEEEEEEEVGPVVTHITFPFSYRGLHFNFDNIPTVLGAAVELLGGWVIDYQRKVLVSLIREFIGSEVPSLVCTSYRRAGAALAPVDTGDMRDGDFRERIGREEGGLVRDRLAESTFRALFTESVLRHLQTRGSPLRSQLDPLQLFPIEFAFKKDVYSANVEACDAYIHNIDSVQLDSVFLARDPSLKYSALRIQFRLPITWVSGFYAIKNAYLFTFIPAGGSGDFNVDLKDVRVSLEVVLRNSQEGGLQMEHFKVDSDWQNIVFKFDGLWSSGLGEIADKVMNQLGLGSLIVEKQKTFIMGEIKTYLRGLAVCMMWSPSQGIDQCMRQFWEGLGWEWPWSYPTCK